MYQAAGIVHASSCAAHDSAGLAQPGRATSTCQTECFDRLRPVRLPLPAGSMSFPTISSIKSNNAQVWGQAETVAWLRGPGHRHDVAAVASLPCARSCRHLHLAAGMYPYFRRHRHPGIASPLPLLCCPCRSTSRAACRGLCTARVRLRQVRRAPRPARQPALLALPPPA